MKGNNMFRFLTKKKRKDEVDDTELRMDKLVLQTESFFYIASDDGKDTLVNKRLRKKADQLEKLADGLETFIKR